MSSDLKYTTGYLFMLAIVYALATAAISSPGFQSVVEIALRRGETGTIKFDTQNQKFLACVEGGARCQEVRF